MGQPSIRRSGSNGRRSTCVAHDGVLYTSGITTVDLAADTTTQARDVIAQLDRLMAMNGTDKHHVLQVTVYLRDMADYGAFNGVWDEWVDSGFEPARSVVQAEAALEEYRIKISLVAAIP